MDVNEPSATQRFGVARGRVRVGVLRGVLLLAGVLTPVLAAPATAAPAGSLVLSGGGSSSVDIDVRRTSTLQAGSFRMTTRGSYAGIAVLDRQGKALAVALNVTDWIKARPVVADFPVTSTLEKVTLKPGRYRLLLLADAPSTVRLGATGDLVRTVRTWRAYNDDVRITQLTGPATDSVVTGSAPVTLRRGGFVAVALHSETTLNQLAFTQVCLAQPGSATCSPTGDIGANNLRQNIGGTIGPAFSSLRYTSTDTFAGRYDARTEYATAEASGRRFSLVVTI